MKKNNAHMKGIITIKRHAMNRLEFLDFINSSESDKESHVTITWSDYPFRCYTLFDSIEYENKTDILFESMNVKFTSGDIDDVINMYYKDPYSRRNIKVKFNDDIYILQLLGDTKRLDVIFTASYMEIKEAINNMYFISKYVFDNVTDRDITYHFNFFMLDISDKEFIESIVNNIRTIQTNNHIS